MNKDELYRQMQRVKGQIAEAKAELAELEEKWDVLGEFARNCTSRAEAFASSVQRRRNRLSTLGGLLSKMRSAERYSQRMNELLNGRDYKDAKNSVDALMDQLSRQKSQLRRQIGDKEDRIQWLRAELDRLRLEYDSCPEEVAEDGEE